MNTKCPTKDPTEFPYKYRTKFPSDYPTEYPIASSLHFITISLAMLIDSQPSHLDYNHF